MKRKLLKQKLKLSAKREDPDDGIARDHVSDKYGWKQVKIEGENEVSLTDGFFGLEELEGSEAERLLKELVGDKKIEMQNDDEEENEGEDENDDEIGEGEEDEDDMEDEEQMQEEEGEFVPPPEMAAWGRFNLAGSLMRGLFELGFLSPTPVQESALHSAIICGNDVVGAAQTGSGKTLAYGLPLLQHIVTSKSNPKKRKGPTALILCPTRELALQVTDHLKNVAKFCFEGSGKSRQNVMIVPVVGGMSQQKQHRLLNRFPAVVVATPGRLWEFVSKRNASTGEQYLANVGEIRFLVIDEADRLTQTGRFGEMQNLLDILPYYKEKKHDDSKSAPIVLDEADDEFWKANVDIPEEEFEVKKTERQVSSVKRCTYLFSATLGISKEAKTDLRRWKKNLKKNSVSGLERVLSLLDFHRHVEVFDLTAQNQQRKLKDEDEDDDRKTITVADGVKQTYMLVTLEEKDCYLYSFLRHYSATGRTLVFFNAITGVKRMAAILKICGLDVMMLHASMQQRQRLKNLDRFKNRPNSVLLATDVAARGLDIPQVAHVLHFDVPRNAELYIHRAGRTARANTEGLSLVLVSPNDSIAFDQLRVQCKTGMRKFPLEAVSLSKQILHKAKEIDVILHGHKKETFEKNWKQKGEADLGEEKTDGDGNLVLNKEQKFRIRVLTDELNKLIALPFFPKGMSVKYPTKSADLMKMISEVPNALKDLEEKTKSRNEKAAPEPKTKKRKKKAFFYKPKK